MPKAACPLLTPTQNTAREYQRCRTLTAWAAIDAQAGITLTDRRAAAREALVAQALAPQPEPGASLGLGRRLRDLVAAHAVSFVESE